MHHKVQLHMPPDHAHAEQAVTLHGYTTASGWLVASSMLLALASHCSAQGTPVLAELWNRRTEQWTSMAPMGAPRTYHSVAVLMPDGRVFSGGGGLCGQETNGCAIECPAECGCVMRCMLLQC